MRKFLSFILVMAMGAMFAGCQGADCTHSGGNSGLAIVRVLFLSSGNPIKTTGVRVELIKKENQEVVRSILTNNEDKVDFTISDLGDSKVWAFLRVTLANGRIYTSLPFEYYANNTKEFKVEVNS